MERSFGPASGLSQRLGLAMKLTLRPFVANWRPTPRGIRLARLIFEPGTALPALRGTQIDKRLVGGAPGEWTVAPRAREVDHNERVILYLHGGGFVIGSARTHRNLVSRISHVTATPVFSVDYRMAPQATLTASRSDAVAAYRGLIEAGHPADSIVLAGDSAGGGLALYVALHAIEQGFGVPAALVLLSPWVDLTSTSESIHTNAGSDFFIGSQVLGRIAHALVPDPAQRAHWHNSPLHAPDALLAQLPPTLVQVGGAEVLRDEGIELGRRIGAAGGAAEVQTYDGQGHVVAVWSGTPEARRATKEIARWLREALPPLRRPSAPSEADLDAATAPRDPRSAGPGAFPG